MRVSLNWLSEYVDVPCDLKAFCDRLDLTGTGVEGVERTGDTYDNVVTGQILTKERHPDSDHMWVTTVDVGSAHVGEDGNPEPLQIVCGAQNFEAGDHIVVALIGAVLPGDVKIKKSKLRGIVSYGMNCSERELGLGSSHEGIMILPQDAPVGMPLAEYLGSSDTVLDLEITPNRPDCLSMVGMAREVGAMYDIDATDPLSEIKAHLADYLSKESSGTPVSVEIADPDRCARYTARVIRDIKVGPSPDWLARRVTAAGARSINNVVDITNYILFLFGQPLHTFDFDKVTSADGAAHIVVRGAKQGEKLVTLDGEERTLTTDMTVIATPERPVALAGVMGGLDSEVDENTTSVLLETATFAPGRTSRTSRNLGLISESSLRYERRVDDISIADISDAAAALIAEVSGGTVCSFDGDPQGLVDEYLTRTEPQKLTLRVSRLQSMLGADIPRDFIKRSLTRLGCMVSDTQDENVLSVVAPTYRPDLEREIDLYEEVLRLYGMDRIEPTLPGGRGRFGTRTHEQKVRDVVNATLRASGLNETVTYSFGEPDDLAHLRMSSEGLGEPVELINPMNAEQSVMRQSIIPGLLRSVAYNQNHGVENVALYESGKVFSASEGHKKPKERNRIAGVLAGRMHTHTWNAKPETFDFFDGKGAVENLLRELSVAKVRFKPLSADEAPHLQPGRAASVYAGGAILGWVGEIHPLAVAAFEAQAPVVAFELDLDGLAKAARPARDYQDVPQFPSVDIDVAFVVDESVTHEMLEQRMRSAGGKLLESAQLFDVYRDAEHIGAGKKSMAYSLSYRAADRTLSGEEVEKAHERLVKKVCKATGAEVRG